MWFAIAFVVSLLLVTAFAPKREVEDARLQGLGDNPFPKSKYGDVLPVVFGTCEQKSPIIMWYGDFKPVAEYENVSTGLFSSSNVITGYRYRLGFDLGICLGPNVYLRAIKTNNGRIVWGGDSSRAGDTSNGYENISIQYQEDMGGGIEYYAGKFNQPISSYLNSNSQTAGGHFDSGAGVDPLPNYKGVCHAVFVEFFIGNTPIPKKYSFIVENLSTNLSEDYSVIGVDLNPMEIVYTVLTQKWGFLGLDIGLVDVDNFLEVAEVLHGEGLGMSMVIDGEKTGQDVIEECMRVADGVMYQEPTTGKIKVKLIRDDYTVGLLPVLDKTNISKLENYGRTTREDLYNQVRLQFQDRSMDYQTGIAVVQDFAGVLEKDRIKSTTITMPGVKNPAVAATLASRELRLLSSPLIKCDLRCNRVAKDWRPGDLFVLNWEPYNLTNAVMRILKIDFGTLEDNYISISAVQDVYSQNLASFTGPDESGHVPIDTGAAETTVFDLWEAPLFLIKEKDFISPDEIYIYENNTGALAQALAPDNNSVSHDTFISSTSAGSYGGSYGLAAEQEPYIGGGLLEDDYAATVAADDGIDSSSSMIVKNVPQRVIDELIDNADFDAARNGTSMFRINNELFVFVGFTDLTGGRVQFTDVYRAMLDTGMANHSEDDVVYFIKRGSNKNKVLIPHYYTVYYKIANRTPIGRYDLDSITPSSKVFVNRPGCPLPPKYLLANGSRPTPSISSASTITMTWKPRSRLDPELYAYNEDYDSTHADDSGPYGIRYRLTYIVNGGTPVVVDGLVNPTYVIPAPGVTGNIIVIVWSYYENRFAQTIFSYGSESMVITLT